MHPIAEEPQLRMNADTKTKWHRCDEYIPNKQNRAMEKGKTLGQKHKDPVQKCGKPAHYWLADHTTACELNDDGGGGNGGGRKDLIEIEHGISISFSSR